MNDYELIPVKQSKPTYKPWWVIAAEYNKETRRLKQEALYGNIKGSYMAQKQLLRVHECKDDSYFGGC